MCCGGRQWGPSPDDEYANYWRGVFFWFLVVVLVISAGHEWGWW